MPTYEYHCEACDKNFELFQSIKSDPIAKCEKCGHECKRVFSTSGNFILKGLGFYNTDYKNKPQTKTNSGSTSKTTIDTKAQKRMNKVAS